MNYCFQCGGKISNKDECLICKLNVKEYRRLFGSYQNFEQVIRMKNEYRFLPEYLLFKSRAYLQQGSMARKYQYYK